MAKIKLYGDKRRKKRLNREDSCTDLQESEASTRKELEWERERCPAGEVRGKATRTDEELLSQPHKMI